MTQPRIPLYVRLPAGTARKLDHVAYTRGASKQDIVSGLIATLDDRITLGKHEFRPNAAEVLTSADVAELLQIDEAVVVAMAERGELPGRKLGEQWRFARAAVLRWLGHEADEQEEEQ